MMNRKVRRIIGCLLAIVLSFSLIAVMPVQAATYEAKIGSTNYATLEAAISAATAGQTVVVLSDVTLENSLTISKEITIATDGVADHTIKFSSGGSKYISVTAAATLKGTASSRLIFDGCGQTHDLPLLALKASGISMSYVTVQNNVSSYEKGGGVYINSTGITLTYCDILNNKCTGSYGGGGIYLLSTSQVKLYNCMIKGNTATQRGGGIFIAGVSDDQHAQLNTYYTEITNNNAGVSHGGVYVTEYGTCQFSYGCTVRNNSSPYTGSHSVIDTLPKFSGTLLGYTDGTNNANNVTATSNVLQEAAYKLTSGGDTYSSYCTKLTNAGFSQQRTKTIDGNIYTVFTGNSKTVTVMYTPNLDGGSIRLLVENGTTLPTLTSALGTKTTTPAVAMVRIDGSDIGMDFIYRLSDGRFIIIDGGCKDNSTAGTSDAKSIYNAMKIMSGSSDVKVAAWILTHMHSDHVNAFCSYWNNSTYSSHTTIEKVIFNAPNEDIYAQGVYSYRITSSCSKAVYNITSGFSSSTKIIKAHPGQVFTIGDATITMLYTAELAAPGEMWNFNDTSLVFTVKIGGTTFFHPGDASSIAGDVLSSIYSSAMKSDVLQVSHHGAYPNVIGAAVYQAVDPEYVFWPSQASRYDENSTYWKAETNKWLFDQRDMNEMQIWCAEEAIRMYDISNGTLTSNPVNSCNKSHKNMTALSATSGTISPGYYYLSANKTLTGNLTVSSGNVTLCLNGKTLSCGSYGIRVSGGTLNICDCGSGKIVSTASSGEAIWLNGGDVNLYDVTVQNTCNSSDSPASAKAINDKTGVLHLERSKVTSIIGNSVYVQANGKLTAENDTVIVGGYHAVAVSQGKTYLYDCNVSNTHASMSTVYTAGGMLQVSPGATISGPLPVSINAADTVASTAQIYGGTFNSTGNYAINNYSSVNTIKLKGEPVINSGKADFYLQGDSKITLSGTVSGGPYTVLTSTAPTVGSDVQFTTNLSTGMAVTDCAQHFAPANSDYAIRVASKEGYLHIHATDGSILVGATPATCTEVGYSGDILCSSCGEVATAGEVIPKTEHTVVADAAVPATCTEPGLTAGAHCSVCLQTITEQEEIPALGHTIVSDEAVPATCTETGLTAGTHCSVCCETVKAQEEIPALGHDYTSEVTTEATCLTAGVKTYTCTRCNDSYTEEIPVIGHTPAEAVEENRVEPTCIEAGHYDTVIYCAVCHAELSRATTELPATAAHVPGEAVVENTVAATCVTPGSYELVSYCIVCGERVFCIPGTVPATGKHTAAAPVQENVVAATCTAAGSYENVTYCKDCGTELSRETVTVSALGHQYGAPVDNADGTHTMACACGDSITEAHTFENGVCVCGAEEVTFGIVSASLRLDRDIDIIFHVAVPDGAQNIRLTVETEADTVILTDFEKDGENLCFIYADLNPQQIGDLLTATLSARIDGRTKFDTLDDYSIRQYCVNLLISSKYSKDEKLHTLLSDLLVYGAAAQTYMDYNTDTLVTDGLTLTPSTFAPISGKTVSFTGTADANTDWIGARLVLSDSVTMRFGFCAASTENLSVRVCINGREETFTAFESDGTGKYYIDFNGIEATEFDDTVSASFYRNGGKLGRTVNYSVNTYICSTQNSTDTDLQTLVRALYNYGASAKQYATK